MFRLLSLSMGFCASESAAALTPTHVLGRSDVRRERCGVGRYAFDGGAVLALRVGFEADSEQVGFQHGGKGCQQGQFGHREDPKQWWWWWRRRRQRAPWGGRPWMRDERGESSSSSLLSSSSSSSSSSVLDYLDR